MYTIKQFETAITALPIEAELKEAKLKNGKVREFIGTVDGKKITWDLNGKASDRIERRPELDLNFSAL